MEIKITKKQQSKYKDNPNKCPFCDSVDLAAMNNWNAEDSTAWRTVECLECNMQWDEVFKLINIADAEQL